MKKMIILFALCSSVFASGVSISSNGSFHKFTIGNLSAFVGGDNSGKDSSMSSSVYYGLGVKTDLITNIGNVRLSLTPEAGLISIVNKGGYKILPTTHMVQTSIGLQEIHDVNCDNSQDLKAFAGLTGSIGYQLTEHMSINAEHVFKVVSHDHINETLIGVSFDF